MDSGCAVNEFTYGNEARNSTQKIRDDKTRWFVALVPTMVSFRIVFIVCFVGGGWFMTTEDRTGVFHERKAKTEVLLEE